MKSRICSAINPAINGHPYRVRCHPATYSPLASVNPLLVKLSRYKLRYWLRGTSLFVILGWMMFSLMLIAERKEQRRTRADEVCISSVVAACSQPSDFDSSAWVNIPNR